MQIEYRWNKEPPQSGRAMGQNSDSDSQQCGKGGLYAWQYHVTATVKSAGRGRNGEVLR